MWVVMDDVMELNDVVLDDTLLLSPPPSSPSLGPDPFSIGSEPWVIAEKATDEIIGQIQPTVASQERRRKVIDYVQRLLKSHILCEVFPFGSVPLKTYLPDGDIDLTAFGGFGLEDSLANVISSILEAEGQNPSAECRVKDVQYIRAEVKLVKCLVQNIVVDISFNQLGGLCTLCFLEQVDCLIDKNHLFKRSIILIKAWCYYESRILGAHHGLISTYALETLVLYIFHRFHSSLDGPLAVLYTFLDYFSKFDWKNLCVSLSGPIPLSSLPESVKGVVEPENSGSDLLLSDDFLKECLEKFSVSARGPEASSRTFHPKHLNIVDPLREDNNLGRSISEGNFYRIRSAFSYGARKLGQILRRPNEDIAGEVCKFFTNTLNRHGKGMRPDLQDSLPVPTSDFVPGLLLSAAELAHEDWSSPESEYINSKVRYDEGNAGSQELEDVVNAFAGTGMDLGLNRTSNWRHRGSQKSAFAEAEKGKDDICVSGARLSGDAEDMATTGARTRMKNGLHSPNGSKSLVNNVHHAPHLYFSRTLPNGKIESGHQDDKKPENSRHLGAGESRDQEIMHSHGNHEPLEVREKTSSSALTQESFCTEDSQCSCSSSSSSDRLSSEAVGCREASIRLPDLSGDFDNNLENLRDARRWSDHALGVSFQAMHQRVPGKSPWDPMQFPLHMPPNMFPHQVNPNGVMPRPPPFFHTPPMVPGPFGVEELPRPRGTGTYFPNPSYYSYRERHSPGKGRVQVPLKSPRGNGRVATFSDKSLHGKNSNRDQSVQPLPQSPGPSPRGKSFRKDANGFMEPYERGEELASVRQPPPEAAAPEGGQQLSSMTAVATEGPPAMTDNKLAVQMYRLKDEEDFPPLSS